MTEEIKGRVACRGRVEGPVRVVLGYSDLAKVREGDIMVAQQTDVNFTPALRRAAGLIAEDGARFCHAAIYARENELPCIIGIADACNRLQNAEWAVLDADANVVTIGKPRKVAS